MGKLENDVAKALVEIADKKPASLVDVLKICLDGFGYAVKNVTLKGETKIPCKRKRELKQCSIATIEYR